MFPQAIDFLNYFSLKLPTTFARISIASEKHVQ